MDIAYDVHTEDRYCPQCKRITRHEIAVDEVQIALDPPRYVRWAECMSNGAEHGHEVTEGRKGESG